MTQDAYKFHNRPRGVLMPMIPITIVVILLCVGLPIRIFTSSMLDDSGQIEIFATLIFCIIIVIALIMLLGVFARFIGRDCIEEVVVHDDRLETRQFGNIHFCDIADYQYADSCVTIITKTTNEESTPEESFQFSTGPGYDKEIRILRQLYYSLDEYFHAFQSRQTATSK